MAKKKQSIKRDIEFLFELGTLRHTQRAWRSTLGMDVANVLEHTMRVTWTALIISRMEGMGDEGKIIKMALVHDLAEIRGIDLNYYQKLYATVDEERSAHDTFENTSVFDYYSDILHEYEKRESIEARIVKDADNLDVDIELKELEERGSTLPLKWKDTRKIIRTKKLYTKSAQKLWDALQSADVSSWHLMTNKWYKQPEAGK